MQRMEFLYEYIGEGVMTMDDRQIVELYFLRQERALTLTAEKYGAYCTAIARNILADPRDAEECVNDTYLAAWNSIPPQRPARLSAFLAKLTRRISIDKLRKNAAQKRGGLEIDLVFDELAECIADESTPEKELSDTELARIINQFLASLGETERKIFLRRYFYAEPITLICRELEMSESRVKSILYRSREKLKKHLVKEGYYEIR